MIKTVTPASSLKGTIQPPSDKSISQRAAIFALLHEKESVIRNYSLAEDPQSTLTCIQQLGARVCKEGDTLIINGVGRDGLQEPAEDLDCGNSGTAMRLLTGVLTGSGVSAKLIGDESLCARTMSRVIKPMERMGAHILARNGAYCPLFVNRLEPLKPMDYELPIASAQLKSCVLLAGLFGNSPTRVIERVPSRDHTERLLGLKVEESEGYRIISASREDEVPNQSYTIPGDFSSAAFWLVAGSIVPDSDIVLKDTGLNPTRNALLQILIKMGADITVDNERKEGAEPIGDIKIRASELNATDIPRHLIPNCIDELPILAVAMAFAEGTSEISGAGELRHKETDRITAIAQMLQAVNAEFEEKEDGLVIYGKPGLTFESATFQSFHDHRIAMASAVLSLKGNKESTIIDADCAAVSYPQFWEDLEKLTVGKG